MGATGPDRARARGRRGRRSGRIRRGRGAPRPSARRPARRPQLVRTLPRLPCLPAGPPMGTGSPSLGHAMPDGTTRLTRPDGQPVLPYLAIGTFAERQVVPATAVIAMPEGTTPEVAALIGCCGSTGVGSVVKTAAVEPGSTVVVIGLGGVGLSCVMGAVLAGASRIVAVDRLAAKLELARELGATDVA